jgi:hypothetical protein
VILCALTGEAPCHLAKASSLDSLVLGVLFVVVAFPLAIVVEWR